MAILSEPVGFANALDVGQAEGGSAGAMKDAMGMSPMFWTAFWAGMAAPVSLYAAPTAYAGYVAIPSPAQSFAMVGGYLSAAAEQVQNDRRAG